MEEASRFRRALDLLLDQHQALGMEQFLSDLLKGPFFITF